MKAKWYALPVLLITMLLFVSLAGAQETVQTLRVAVGANDPRSIDPQQAIDTKDWTLLSHLFPGLTVLDEETKEIEPGLAQSWEVSGDGLTYTFHLLEGVPWVRYNAATDAVEQVLDDAGNPRVVTAEDVAFGWTRALDPATGSPAAYILAPYVEGGEAFNAGEAGADAVAIEAVDDYTFRVTAPESVGFALGIYSIINARPTPEWAITAAGDAWTEPENINTYGPYTLKEWQHEGSLTFVKNPFWPGSAGVPEARIDEVELLLIDEVAGLRAYEAGTIDAATVPGDQLARIQASAELGNQVEIVPDTCSQAWGFNTEKAPFDNVHIRRAFNYAVDRQALIESVLGGGEIPAFFFTPPSISLAPSSTASSELGIHFDPALAKEELQLGLNDLGLSSADQLPPINVQFGTSPVLSAGGAGAANHVAANARHPGGTVAARQLGVLGDPSRRCRTDSPCGLVSGL